MLWRSFLIYHRSSHIGRYESFQLHPPLKPFDYHIIQRWRQTSGLPSPQKFAFTLSRPDLGWLCSSRFHIYIIKWKTRRLQYWLINKYTGINSYYYHSLPFWLRAKRFLTSVEKAFDLGRKGIRLKAKGLWPGCLTTETYPLSLNIESSEADLVSDEGKHKRWRQFADDGETP